MLYWAWYRQGSTGNEDQFPAAIAAALIVAVAIETTLHPSSWLVPAVLVAPVSIVIAFLSGYGFAGYYTNISHHPEYVHQIKSKDGSHMGKIIRSGERGFLYVDISSGQIIYRRWEEVQAILGTRRYGKQF
jgi:hypothetical protein